MTWVSFKLFQCSGLLERRPDRGGEKRHQFGDVVDGFDVENGFLDSALAVCGDHGARQAPVLVNDVGVGEHSIASATRVGYRLLTSAAVFEREAHSSGLSLV